MIYSRDEEDKSEISNFNIVIKGTWNLNDE